MFYIIFETINHNFSLLDKILPIKTQQRKMVRAWIWSQDAWVEILTLPFSCVTLGNHLTSLCPSPHL